MALIKLEDIKKMDKKARNEKIRELNFELIKANVAAHKSAAKTKEIKRTIARLITFNTSDKEVLKRK